MTTLSVTANGQITLERDLLQHLGIEYGDKVEVTKLPNGELIIKAKMPTQDISTIFGALKDKTNGKVATLEEIEETIKSGWSDNVV